MRWLNFILSHSIYIAVCAVALVFQTSLLLHFQTDAYLYAFVFFATLCSYNFYWLLSSYSLQRPSVSYYFKTNVSKLFILVAASCGMLVCAWHLQALLPYMLAAIGLTVLYAVPLMPFKVLHFTRRAGFIKTVLLSFTWAYVTVFIPYKQSTGVDEDILLLFFMNRFLLMLMLCIIFDKRDIELDKVRGLHTLATDIRPAVLKTIFIIVFCIFLGNGILLRFYFHDTIQIAALLFTGVITAFIYYYSFRKQGYFFYYFLVDGVMLFSAVATYVASIS